VLVDELEIEEKREKEKLKDFPERREEAIDFEEFLESLNQIEKVLEYSEEE